MAEAMTPKGKLDVTAAPAFHADLVARAGQDIVIDLEEVTLMGTLCLQVCIAAARDARSSDTKFTIENASDPVLVQLSSMGFTPETLAEGTI